MLIRTRLTLSFLLVVGVLLALFSVAVFEATRAGVLAEIEREVQGRAIAISRSVTVDADGRLRSPPLDALAMPGLSVQLFAADGVTLARSGDMELPFLPQAFEAGRVEETRVDGVPVFLFGQPVGDREQVDGFVVVGRSPGPLYQVLHRLREVLLPGVALALGLAGLAMWVLIRRTMGPLVRLVAAAEEISAHGDHTGRIGSGGRADEIGQLASTIDGMLAALADSHGKVAAANAAQRRFLMDVSHELRAPLTIVLSSLELLERIGSEDPAFREQVLTDTRAEVERIARMVTRLLIIARTGDDTAAASQPLLLGELLVDVCRHWSRRPTGRQFDWEGIGTLDNVVVEGDEDYLRQLFLILLENAFKFTPEGGRVAVDGTTFDEHIDVTVSDTGVGIAPEDLPRVFDRFYQARNGQSRTGMGLGLSIARHIAEHHGGEIRVSSIPGTGSRFTVRLPVYAGDG